MHHASCNSCNPNANAAKVNVERERERGMWNVRCAFFSANKNIEHAPVVVVVVAAVDGGLAVCVYVHVRAFTCVCVVLVVMCVRVCVCVCARCSARGVTHKKNMTILQTNARKTVGWNTGRARARVCGRSPRVHTHTHTHTHTP